MNHAHSYLAKTEIAKQLGYFPEFLNSATNSSLIFRSLVQQTLSAYINNPLPDLFKEKLFVGLSRYCGASYFTICHSCTLLSLGVSATEILALEKVSIPQGEADIAFDLDLLRSQWHDTKDWHNPSLETSLLHCSYFIFLHPFQANSCINTLKELLGTFYYHYLAVFLEYIKLCHYWLGNNPEISHQKDLRSQLHLHSLLSSDNRLADFLQSTTKLEISNSNKIAIESCSPQKEHLPKFKIEQKSLIKYLTNLSFPVMIRSQDEKVLYLNHNWVETTGYNKADIPTVATWKQKAEVKSCNTKQLATEIYPATEHHFSWQSSETDTQAGNILSEIATFLSNLAEKNNHLEVDNSVAQVVKSQVAITTRKGKQRFWQYYTALFSLGKEKEELTISIARDITKTASKKTSQTETKNSLDLLPEVAHGGNWSWDLVNNRIEICRHGLRILSLDDFDGSYESFLLLIHPKARESINSGLVEAIKNNRGVNLQYPIVKTNYAISWIQQNCKLEYNSAREAIKLSGIIMNITPPKPNSLKVEQVKQEQQSNVKQSYDELAKIIDLLPSYVFVSHVHDETISLINLKLSDSLGLSKSEVVYGKTISECFPSQYARQVLWHQQQVLTYGREVHVQEEVKLSDGVHYFDTKIAPLRNDSGEIYAVLHTSNDIPDLAATKEALSQRTSQLEAANKELESFSYSVSHDLQAPLRVINGFSQVLWENYQPDLDDRGKHYLQRIQANSEKMSDLIDALLQLSRVTRSQMKSVEVNLSKIALGIMGELRQRDPDRNVEFTIGDNLLATGDPQLLRIVLDNLLNNAWKYTSKRSQGKIEFNTIASEENKPTFYVKDNGAGFDLEYADKLFTAFKRLHSQAEFPGTGIGLATVQRIIYRHGGKVWADGECDLGATIYFSL